MLSAGDTFRAANSSIDEHLWVVISDPTANPDDDVLIVNLTSWRSDRERVCVLNPGDHPFVTRKTCVNYRESRLIRAHQLEHPLRTGALVTDNPFDAEVLQRIREGAAQSERIPLQNAELLRQQGLIQ